MANESGELPLTTTPELTKSCEVKIRRYSADKASSGNGAEKIVPHYLRASTGSCHDFCKYGKNDTFELKDRRSIPNRATRKQLHQSSEESIGAITVSVPRSRLSVDSKPKVKMSMVMLKESVGLKTRISDASDMNTHERPTKSVDRQKHVGNEVKVMLKESVGSKTRISDASDMNTHERPTKSVDRQKHVGNEVKVNRKKTSLVNVKPSLLLKSHTSSSTKQEISSLSSSPSSAMQSSQESTSRMAETSSKSTPKKVKTLSKSTPEKLTTPSKSTLDKVRTVSKSIPKEEVNLSKLALKVKTSSKSTSKMENLSKPTLKKVENPSKSIPKVRTSSTLASKIVGTSSKLSPLNGKEMKLSAKDITSLNSNRVTRKKTSSINSSEAEVKLEKRVASSKAVSRKLMTPVKPLSSPRISLKRVASINSRKHWGLKTAPRLRNQQNATKVEPEEHDKTHEVEEKTLYVIKMESENKTLQSDINVSYGDELYLPQLLSPKSSSSSPQEDQEESEYTTSEFEQDSYSGSHEIESMEDEATFEVEKKGKPSKDGTICHEDKMRKLKFRRGKVVDNEIEKNTPRRLKFRRAKTLLVEKANVKDDTERKRFKTKDEIESNSASIAAEKVVLKHQDMQDKKDAQGLLNNVIEETASKLVETRKSKVKALVGAFETVISLHEKKPSSANNVS